MFGESTKELSKDTEKCLDSQLWHACAGGMVVIPRANSRIYYFPQGQAEHSIDNVDFGNNRMPPFILCRVTSVKFLADRETDEVYCKIKLIPISENELNYDDNADEHLTLNLNNQGLIPEKPASFAKTLTQSDANNGGGFSVPRYCAETIFPRLDYSKEPPLQTVYAKDVHGQAWKFRHIYRGTPRRHLLTTGWSTFVNQKKLAAGDSIVFVRTENGEICVGIRRAKIELGANSSSISGWTPPHPCGFSMFIREEEGKMIRGNGNNGRNSGGKGRVKAETVVEAATLAASGQAFEIVYYPRASTPEFCVKEEAVKAAMRIRWCPGMRFKMPFETEDSSRISWFMGTVSLVQVSDPLRWPNSPWRLLEVTWDEPDLLQNVKRVNPWLVELVSNIPPYHLTSFSPPRKKFRPSPLPDLPLNIPKYLPENHHPLGIQGARHAQFGNNIALPNLHINRFHTGFYPPPPPKISTDLFINSKPTIHNDVSCLLTIGTATNRPLSPKTKKSNNDNGKTPLFFLFGQPILTEDQIPMSNLDKLAHCKVFMKSEDVGRTIDLSILRSYEDLYEKLADMFDIQISDMRNRVVYSDAFGVVKNIGDEPFSKLKKKACRLTLLTESNSDNCGGSTSQSVGTGPMPT